MAIGLENALFSAREVIAMGPNAMAVDLKKGRRSSAINVMALDLKRGDFLDEV